MTISTHDVVVFDPWLQLLAELMEKRAPFNGMRGKRGEELGQEGPQVTSALCGT